MNSAPPPEGLAASTLPPWAPTTAATIARPRPVELGVLFAANAAATALRYLLLRIWVFGPGRERAPEAATSAPNGDGDLQGLAPCPPRPSPTHHV